jgi:predicted AlkP superfamily phosphohydrolase/phosphomutase
MLALISFDAVSRALFDRMIAQGRLPNCDELLRRGTTYAIESTPIHASVYRSLYTGRSLSAHGEYYPLAWSASDQCVRPAAPLNPEDSLFTRLDRAGKRILVIDPPECGWFNPRGGVAVCGWQFSSRFVLPEWYSSKRMSRMLNGQFGAPKNCDEVFGEQSVPRLRAMNDVLQSASQRLADATAACLKEGDFEFLWITFAAPHIAGHQLWLDSLDSTNSNSKQSPSVEPKMLAEIYRKADEALGQILAALPPQTDVIVFSPNGMGPETSRADFLPAMLTRVLDGRSHNRTASPPGSGLWRLRAIAPTNLRALVASVLPDRLALQLAAYLENAGVDRKTTKAFAVPSDGSGFVRLNLKGRERDGIVDPVDADKLLDEIETGLGTFVEPSGEKMVTSFLRASELDVLGPRSSSLPDLVVLWSPKPQAALRSVSSPWFGEVRREGVGSGRSGNHCHGAWACIVPAGPRQVAPDLASVRAVDLASTACAVLGVPCADLPGRSLLI